MSAFDALEWGAIPATEIDVEVAEDEERTVVRWGLPEAEQRHRRPTPRVLVAVDWEGLP